MSLFLSYAALLAAFLALSYAAHCAVDGWWKLADAYRASGVPEGTWFRRQDGAVLRGMWRLDACLSPQGLYVALSSPLFQLMHPPLLVPWNRMEAIDGEAVVLRDPAGARIRLPPKVLAEAGAFLAGEALL